VDLSDSEYCLPFYRRSIAILEKIEAEPGIKTGVILNRFTEFEREEISPPLTPVLLQVLLEALADLDYIKIQDGKAPQAGSRPAAQDRIALNRRNVPGASSFLWSKPFYQQRTCRDGLPAGHHLSRVASCHRGQRLCAISDGGSRDPGRFSAAVGSVIVLPALIVAALPAAMLSSEPWPETFPRLPCFHQYLLALALIAFQAPSS
jgi:hypothetical protein